MAFLGLGLDPPQLPLLPAAPDKNESTAIDMTQVFWRVRFNARYTRHAPFVTWEDINAHSLEFCQKIRPSIQEVLPRVLQIGNPGTALLLALEDYVMWQKFLHTAYLTAVSLISVIP